MKFVRNIEQTSYFNILCSALERVFNLNEINSFDDFSNPFTKLIYKQAFRPQKYFNESDIKYAFESTLFGVGVSITGNPFDYISDVELMECFILATFCYSVFTIDRGILPSLKKRGKRFQEYALKCALECSLDNEYEVITDMLANYINFEINFDIKVRLNKFFLSETISKGLCELVQDWLENEDTLDFAKYDENFIDDLIQISIDNEKHEITAMLIDYKYKNNLFTEKKWEL